MDATAPSATRFQLPRIMGHRGVAALAPENTLAGLRAAAGLGLSWVEFDVMLTRDGVPVLFHDDLLKRTTGRPGEMAAHDYAEVRGFDAGQGFHPDFAGETVPSLDQAVAVLLEQNLRPNVEIKSTPGRDVETAQRAIAVLEAAWPSDRPPPMISSFSAMSLAAARVLAPDWPRALIARRVPKDWKAQLQALDCVSFHISAQRGSSKLFNEIHEAGYAVACFTVNERRRAVNLLRDGADCIVTDNPPALG